MAGKCYPAPMAATACILQCCEKHQPEQAELKSQRD